MIKNIERNNLSHSSLDFAIDDSIVPEFIVTIGFSLNGGESVIPFVVREVVR
jgi:hypothetical protein